MTISLRYKLYSPLKTVCAGGCAHHPWQYSSLSRLCCWQHRKCQAAGGSRSFSQPFPDRPHGFTPPWGLHTRWDSQEKECFVFRLFVFSHDLCAGNPDCVKLMIDKGALLEAFDIYFGTPLHAACAKAHLDCALLLLNAGEALFA